MNRLSVAFILFLIFAIPGCADPKSAIRPRFEQLAKHLCDDDVERAVELADPIYVRANGRDKVKFQLKILSTLFRLGKVTPADLRIDDITVNGDGKSAQVKFSMQSQGTWKSQAPTRWVKTDGQWYIAF